MILRLGLVLISFLVGISATVAHSEPTASCDHYVSEGKFRHLRSDTLENGARCLGYFHGFDRGWQMDHLRRIAQGRVAETTGWKSIRQDFFLRMMDFEGQAKSILAGLQPETVSILKNYSEGVNLAWKEIGWRSGRSKVRAWEPTDSLTLLLLQSFEQTRKSFEQDIRENERIAKYGELAAELFQSLGLPWDTTVLKKGEYEVAAQTAKLIPSADKVETKTAQISEFFKDFDSGLSSTHTGSNNWVVAPNRSATGHAWLSNDPHLGLRRPPFWYWVGLETPGTQLFGATLPGSPLFASGTSNSIAFGLTNAYLDVADLVEVDSNKITTVSHRPVIWFKFWKFKIPFFFKAYELTQEGYPVLPLKAPMGPSDGKKWVLRWTGKSVRGQEVDPIFQVNQAKSVAEANELLGRVGLPSWNYVFADTSGRIGYRATGLVPKRTSEPKVGVQSGAISELADWEFLSSQEMPHVLNPNRGFVASANNTQWGGDSKFKGGRAYAASFRAYRIEELLARTQRHTRASLTQILCDHQVPDAVFFVPKLLARLELGAVAMDPTVKSAISGLRDWGTSEKAFATADCVTCGIYRRWMDRLKAELNVNELGLYRLLESNRVPGIEKTLWIELKSAIEDLTHPARAGLPTWRDLHQAPFDYLATTRGDGQLRVSTNGDTHSVNMGESKWVDGRYDHVDGPSHRILVELKNPPEIHGVLAGSNWDLDSMTQKDRDAWEQWARCELAPIEFPARWEKFESKSLNSN